MIDQNILDALDYVRRVGVAASIASSMPSEYTGLLSAITEAMVKVEDSLCKSVETAILPSPN